MIGWRRWWRPVMSATALVLAGAVWALFAPQQFGGRAGYVIITGTSMEPGFHNRDLVIVRRDPPYAVGDIVAFQDRDLGRPVFHRILAREGSRFVMKGDNNGWVDSYTPSEAEIIGRSWITFAGLGEKILWLRLPLNMALAASLVGAGLMVVARARPRMRWRGGRRPRPEQNASPEMKSIADHKEVLLFTSAAVGVAALLLGLAAWLRPATKVVADDIAYTHAGRFTYTAAAPVGLYDEKQVRPGEPVFTPLTCLVDVQFNYQFSSEAPAALSGTYSLVAEVGDTSGWKRTLALLPATRFSGESVATRSPLNLCFMQGYINSMELLTGIRRSTYELAIIPTIKTQGELGGRPFEDTFQPRMTFQFDRAQAQLLRGDPETDPLRPVEEGVLEGSRVEANSIPLFGWKIDVPSARWVSVVGLLLAAAGLGTFGLVVMNASRANRAALVDLKYGPLLVGVGRGGDPSGGRLVDVRSIDDLARLAQHHGLMILHRESPDGHWYYVQDGATIYRYVLRPSPAELAPGPAGDLTRELQLALDRKEFEVHYQVIRSLESGQVSSVEALLRWRHPERGLVSAAEFIPAAEQSGLIVPIGEWALREACNQLRAWHHAGYRQLGLVFNLSPRELTGDGPATIRQVLRETGVDPERVFLEVSERTVMDAPEQIGGQLLELREMGVHVAIDNFSAHTSLAALRHLPIDGLKLGHASIGRVATDADQAAIAQATISAAHSLHLQVVAEGVESQEQVTFLREGRIDMAQGYFFGRPAPAIEVEAVLKEGPQAMTPLRRRRKGQEAA
jgi:signal peptidase I